MYSLYGINTRTLILLFRIQEYGDCEFSLTESDGFSAFELRKFDYATRTCAGAVFRTRNERQEVIGPSTGEKSESANQL